MNTEISTYTFTQHQSISKLNLMDVKAARETDVQLWPLLGMLRDISVCCTWYVAGMGNSSFFKSMLCDTQHTALLELFEESMQRSI